MKVCKHSGIAHETAPIKVAEMDSESLGSKACSLLLEINPSKLHDRDFFQKFG
jgi:hypothetical protein